MSEVINLVSPLLTLGSPLRRLHSKRCQDTPVQPPDTLFGDDILEHANHPELGFTRIKLHPGLDRVCHVHRV